MGRPQPDTPVSISFVLWCKNCHEREQNEALAALRVRRVGRWAGWLRDGCLAFCRRAPHWPQVQASESEHGPVFFFGLPVWRCLGSRHTASGSPDQRRWRDRAAIAPRIPQSLRTRNGPGSHRAVHHQLQPGAGPPMDLIVSAAGASVAGMRPCKTVILRFGPKRRRSLLLSAEGDRALRICPR